MYYISSMCEPDYLTALNEQQKEAVLHRGSPLLVLAGAGSGKTRVITARIAYLISSCGIEPNSILAVTFTNKAAREMSERVSAIVPDGRKVMIRTFHSFGAWLLRRNAAAVGMSSSFTIYDDDDSLSLLHSLYPEYKRNDLKQYMRWISRAKDYALQPGDSGIEKISFDPMFPAMYEKYKNRLDDIGNADFGDLIVKPLELLEEHPEIRNRIRQRFRVVLVDEYQDSNVAQYKLLRELCGDGCELCVVGDDDQSIYRFRGAEVQNILNFSKQFPDTKVIRLEQNYRSTGSILDLATEVVQNNSGRLGKVLWTQNESGSLPKLVYVSDHEQEAEYCAGLLEDGNFANTAILYRTNAQSLAFESCFLKRNIPYKVVGALRFYEREEIKDVLALLSLLLNPRDEVAFRRMVNKPRRGIGPGGLEEIIMELDKSGGNLLEALEAALPSLSSRAVRGGGKFLEVLKRTARDIESEPLPKVIFRLVTDTGLLQYYLDQDNVSSTQRTLNIEELINASGKYPLGVDGLCRFLEDIELDRSRMAEENETGDFVTLITMHNTKGLEFDRVVITGLEQEIFPGYRSRQDNESLEEERRIFYVSITRARKELYLTSASYRLIWGRKQEMDASSFLREIDGDSVETVDLRTTGGYGAPDAVYPPGTGVYHDDYGQGQVVKSWNNGKYEVVLVRFQTGQTAQFIPAYAPLERISLDY